MRTRDEGSIASWQRKGIELSLGNLVSKEQMVCVGGFGFVQNTFGIPGYRQIPLGEIA